MVFIGISKHKGKYHKYPLKPYPPSRNFLGRECFEVERGISTCLSTFWNFCAFFSGFIAVSKGRSNLPSRPLIRLFLYFGFLTRFLFEFGLRVNYEVVALEDIYKSSTYGSSNSNRSPRYDHFREVAHVEFPASAFRLRITSFDLCFDFQLCCLSRFVVLVWLDLPFDFWPPSSTSLSTLALMGLFRGSFFSI